MNSFIIPVSILFLLLISSCKNTPTFVPENTLDPEVENFSPPPPENLRLEVNSTFNELHWTLSKEKSYVVDGFLILRSFSDSSSFIPIDSVHTKPGNKTYHYQDALNPIALNTLYMLRSFYVKNNTDTVFTNSPILSRPNLPQHQVSFVLKPFEQNPVVRFFTEIYSDNDITAELYIHEPDSSNSLIFEIDNNYPDQAISNYDLDVNLPAPKFYYKLRSGEYESDFLDVEGNSSVNNYSFEKEIILENKALNSVQLKVEEVDSNGVSSINPQTFYSSYDISVQAIDSLIVFETENYTFSSPLILDGIDKSFSYIISINGKRGIYETTTKQFRLAFAPAEISRRSYTFNFGGFSDIRTDIDSEKKLIYLSSSSHRDFQSPGLIIIDYSTGHSESTPFTSDHEIGKFIPSFSAISADLITINSSNVLTLWDVNNLVLQKIDSIPSYSNLLAADFDFLSDTELFVLNKPKTETGNIRITVFNTETGNHELLFTIDNKYNYSPRLLYDETRQKLYVFYVDLNLNVESISYDLQTGVRSSPENYGLDIAKYNVKLGDNGKYLHVFDNEDYVAFNTTPWNRIVNYSVDYPIDIRTINTSNTVPETCIATRRSNQNSPVALVDCFHDFERSLKYFRTSVLGAGALLTSEFSEDSKVLVLIFQREILVINFNKEWNLYSNDL